MLACERQSAWDAIYASDRWPQWWPGLVGAVRYSAGDERGLGQRGRYTWQARLRYRVSFEMESTRVEPPRLLEGRASGDLEGSGCWRILDASPAPGGGPATAILLEWRVRLARPGLRWAAPLAGPLLRRNHDLLMNAGARGLAGRLGCELIAAG